MSIEEILDQAEKDFVIPNTESLASEAIRNSSLHSKYMKLYGLAKKKYNAMVREKSRVERELFMYYTGKADVSVLKRKGPIDFKILKSDVDTFIKSDTEMVEIQEVLDDAELKVDTLGRYVIRVKDRGWDIKHAIEYLKFSNGIG
jgi:hypothetical protein